MAGLRLLRSRAVQDRAGSGIQAIPGLRVLEVGRHLGVASAGLFLVALGGDVVQAHPGDRSVPRAESVYYDRGRLNLNVEPGGDLSGPASLADVIVTDLDDSEMKKVGIPFEVEHLRSGPGAQTLVTVRSLGRSGPNSHFRMTDLTEWASTGLANVTRRPHRDDLDLYVPVLPPGFQPQALSGLAAGTAAVVGRRWARTSGEPVVADVSVQEVVAAMLHGIFPNFVWNGVVTGHPSTQATALGMLLPASDGDVYVRTLDPRQWDALVTWVDSEAIRDLGSDPDSRLANNDAISMLVGEWTAPQRRNDLLEEGQRRHVPIALPRSLDDVLSWQHLRARDVWRAIDVGGSDAIAPRLPLVEPPTWKVSSPIGPAALARRWATEP
jgi:crotonobetainyl-CoA:carnitine CoA-transferase CaiB-like acyl-CoA transferase